MIPDMIQEFFIDTMKNSFLDKNFSMVSSATLDTMKKILFRHSRHNQKFLPYIMGHKTR